MEEAKNLIFPMRFPQKLWHMLELSTDAILWGETGRTILLNYRILQSYLQCEHSIFKTTNISSFTRQLNLYGFRKVTSHLQDPLCNSSNPCMHEFIHDNFQYGRPELLKQITRKTWGKKPRPKVCVDHLSISPLQKARRALRIALQKAAQDLLKNTSKSAYFDVPAPEYHNTDTKNNMETVWLMEHSENPILNEFKQPDPMYHVKDEVTDGNKYGEISQESLMDFFDETVQQNNNYPAQFLNVPDLTEVEPIDNQTGVELLAEFNIDSEIDQGIVRKSSQKQSEFKSNNCVLPSVSNENIDEGSMLEKTNEDNMNNYNNDWDQMFSDIMMPNNNMMVSGILEEGVSNLGELLTQTVDLLNC